MGFPLLTFVSAPVVQNDMKDSDPTVVADPVMKHTL